jgi:hypothetical protein
VITGSVATAANLPTPYNGNIGDGYLTQDDGHLHVWDGSQWIDVGTVQGPAGFTGSRGNDGVASVAANTGLELTGSELATIYNTTVSDSLESVAVGGAVSTAASVWKSKNLVEVLDAILFPDLNPTYVIPTAAITASQSGTKEIGVTINQSLVLTTTENDAGAFTNLTVRRNGNAIQSVSNPTGSQASDLPNQFGFTNPNNPNQAYSLSYTDTIVVTAGTTNWSGTGTYSAGLAKNNNKGVADTRTAQVRSTNAPQAAGSITSSSASITGIYPYFWGKSSQQPTALSVAAAILNGLSNKVLSAASGTVAVTYNAFAEYIWMAHPATYTTKTRWYNTELNQGNIGQGNFILTPLTVSVNSPDGNWNNVTYVVYISDVATSTDGEIQFRNS